MILAFLYLHDSFTIVGPTVSVCLLVLKIQYIHAFLLINWEVEKYDFNVKKWEEISPIMGNYFARLLGDGREVVDDNAPFPVSELLVLWVKQLNNNYVFKWFLDLEIEIGFF